MLILKVQWLMVLVIFVQVELMCYQVLVKFRFGLDYLLFGLDYKLFVLVNDSNRLVRCINNTF
jgi:hypothetical protein